MHFFLVAHCTASSFLITSLSGWRGGGMHRGGRGDARASCASPLGTPLPVIIVADSDAVGFETFSAGWIQINHSGLGGGPGSAVLRIRIKVVRKRILLFILTRSRILPFTLMRIRSLPLTFSLTLDPTMLQNDPLWLPLLITH